MPLAFAAGFVALVVAEIYAFVAVANATSVLTAVLLLLATSVIGGSLVRREGARAWMRAARATRDGRPTGADVADAGLLLFAGALLIIPGFVTDAIGLSLVFPPTRKAVRRIFGFVFLRRVTRLFGIRPAGRWRRANGGADPTVIDGEVVNGRRGAPRPPLGD